jgi:hypothetical protein
VLELRARDLAVDVLVIVVPAAVEVALVDRRMRVVGAGREGAVVRRVARRGLRERPPEQAVVATTSRLDASASRYTALTRNAMLSLRLMFTSAVTRL